MFIISLHNCSTNKALNMAVSPYHLRIAECSSKKYLYAMWHHDSSSLNIKLMSKHKSVLSIARRKKHSTIVFYYCFLSYSAPFNIQFHSSYKYFSDSFVMNDCLKIFRLNRNKLQSTINGF